MSHPPITLSCRFCDQEFGDNRVGLARHIHQTHGKELERRKKLRHWCVQCDPDQWAIFGRDVFCHEYQRENMEAQLNEDSEDGRAIRAELAKEAQEAALKKAGPQ